MRKEWVFLWGEVDGYKSCFGCGKFDKPSKQPSGDKNGQLIHRSGIQTHREVRLKHIKLRVISIA